MKRIAKMAFFFGNTFILFFLFSAGFYFLDLLIESFRTLAVGPDHAQNMITALGWAVPVTLYAAVLFCHTYAARKKAPVFVSILMTVTFSALFTFGAFVGIEHLQRTNFSIEPGAAVVKQPGLILSRGDATMVVLSGDGLQGPRVLSFPDQDLLYQGEDWGPVNSILAPALPFGEDAPWSIHSIFIDFRLSARQLEMRFREGFVSFLIYGGSLIVFLSSLRSLLGMSVWPLANLFLGALIFRGILSLEAFLNMPETQFIILSFVEDRVPAGLITPLIFLCLGILIFLYTFLSWLAWGKRRGND